jgi:4-hydroxythreonine-4-phosphate dehydrogenase
MSLPVVAVTMGDAAGIGPEIVVKALAHEELWTRSRPLLVGDLDVFARAAEVVSLPLAFRRVTSAAGATASGSSVGVVVPAESVLSGAALAHADPRAGAAAAAALRAAYDLVESGDVAAVISAPLNKQALHAAGLPYADEVAFLAAETGSEEPVLVGIVDGVATVSATLHVPLRAVPGLLTRERIVRHTEILAETLRALGREPRLALAALNPHAGEGGLLGHEEIDILAPAAAEARSRGIDITDPLPADTVFPGAFSGAFNGVVCLYHDQANIARKLAGIGGASIVVGLPAVLGTTSHGTAYDIAGTGRADPTSIICAIDTCVALACADRRVPAAIDRA